MHFFVPGWKKESCDKARGDFNFYFRKVLVEEIEEKKKSYSLLQSIVPFFKSTKSTSVVNCIFAIGIQILRTWENRKNQVKKSFDNKNATSQGCQDIVQLLVDRYIYHPNSGKILRNLLCIIYVSLCIHFSVKIITRQEIKLGYDFHGLYWTKRSIQCQDTYLGSLNKQEFISPYFPCLISILTFQLLLFFKSSKLWILFSPAPEARH